MIHKLPLKYNKNNKKFIKYPIKIKINININFTHPKIIKNK
jgi:hypothetical protein